MVRVHECRVCVLCMTTFVYFFFVETKNVPIEECPFLFYDHWCCTPSPAAMLHAYLCQLALSLLACLGCIAIPCLAAVDMQCQRSHLLS